VLLQPHARLVVCVGLAARASGIACSRHTSSCSHASGRLRTHLTAFWRSPNAAFVGQTTAWRRSQILLDGGKWTMADLFGQARKVRQYALSSDLVLDGVLIVYHCLHVVRRHVYQEHVPHCHIASNVLMSPAAATCSTHTASSPAPPAGGWQRTPPTLRGVASPGISRHGNPSRPAFPGTARHAFIVAMFAQESKPKNIELLGTVGHNVTNG